MKKIPLWKVIILSIVTLGFYQFYWLAVQKKYLEKVTKSKLPSLGWLISAAVTMFISDVASVSLYFIPEDHVVAILSIVGVLILLVMYSVLICLWWIIMFLRAADSILKPRVTFVWMLIHLLTLGMEMFIAQYYFNRKPDPKQKAPTKRFVALSLTFIIGFYTIAMGGLAALAAVSVQHSIESQNRVNSNPELNELGKKSLLLTKKYDGCIEQLDHDYPIVTEESEADYLAGYDACETIRIEQNKTAEKFRDLEATLRNG